MAHHMLFFMLTYVRPKTHIIHCQLGTQAMYVKMIVFRFLEVV